MAGGAVRVVSPASAPDRNAFGRGVEELERLQYRVRLASPEMHADGYFAGPLAKRAAELQAALLDDENQAVMAPRGGYGTGPVLDLLSFPRAPRPKLVVGYSDLTMLHAYLWRRWRWVTLYGPMVAAGFDKGRGSAGRLRPRCVAECGQRRASALGAGTGRGGAVSRRGNRNRAGRLFDAASGDNRDAVGV